MFRSERHELILQMLKKDGRVSVSDLTEKLNVTEDTVRKDLRELGQHGLLKRVHGGALEVFNGVWDFESRNDYESRKKDELAKIAVKHISDRHKVLFIDAGTTNLKFVENIPHDFNGLVITNSPPIALALCKHPHIQIYSLSGVLDKTTQVNTGSATIQELTQMYADLCIIGVSALDPNIGITAPSFEESLVKKAFIKQSSEVMAIVTSEKIGRISTFFVESTDKLDYIVTEKNLPNQMLEALNSQGITVITDAGE